MRIVARSTLKEFWEIYLDSKTGLLSWYEKMNNADYDIPQEVIADFKGADYVGNERIVFNIAKNKFRFIVSFNYEFKACWIKFVGTHYCTRSFLFLKTKRLNFEQPSIKPAFKDETNHQRRIGLPMQL